LKKLIFIVGIIFSLNIYSETKFSWQIDPSIHKNVPFIKHESSKPFGNYVAMNIHFNPVKDLFKKLDVFMKGKLSKKNARTEAHITIITPPEFDFVLSKHLSIQELTNLAKEMNIQDSKFTIICVGKGDYKEDSTFFLVVRSRKLKDYRKRVFDLYKKKGGDASKFDPNLFYPHITIGYTNKDLHLGPHGVKKGINSCWGKTVK